MLLLKSSEKKKTRAVTESPFQSSQLDLNEIGFVHVPLEIPV